MKKKGFTLVEMVTALAVLVIIISFSSVIFKSSIDAYRVANAETEVMQKLRAITDTLNRDFEGFVTNGYLRIDANTQQRRENKDSINLTDVNMCRIYFFTTGDFQSWYPPYIRSNVARVFWGHDANSLVNRNRYQSEFSFVRDVNLLTPTQTAGDCIGISLSKFLGEIWKIERGEPNVAPEKPNTVCSGSFAIDLVNHPDNDMRRLMCENVGNLKVEWWDDNPTSLGWNSSKNSVMTWNPGDIKPRALKFNFTLYDSKGIIKGGRRFSHIVYLGNRN